MFTSTAPRLIHTLFSTFFPSQLIVKQLCYAAGLEFAPGIYEAPSTFSPPTIDFFRSLPSKTKKRWAVYFIMLKKLGCRSKFYIGSGSNNRVGVASRMSDYERGNVVSRRVRQAIQNGYDITHKGLLCWEPFVLNQLVLRSLISIAGDMQR
jgi:hypothetical protein